jgi:hypothetical protein
MAPFAFETINLVEEDDLSDLALKISVDNDLRNSDRRFATPIATR